MSDSKRDILIVGLRNAYALEGQAIETLSNVQARLQHYPELEAVVAGHLTESRQQQETVQQLLESMGEAPSALKEAVMRLAGNVAAIAHIPAGDEVLKNLFALFAFEHFEQAAYRSLIAMAEDLGETATVQTCRTILAQEEAAAQKLSGLIESVTRAYVHLESSGQTSKV